MPNKILYGFVNLQDAFDERVQDVGLELVNNAIEETLTEHNRQLNALIALFADRTTKFKQRYKTAMAARLQPLDELGRARPIKVKGQYDIAFPLQAAGLAWGETYKASIKMTVQEANNIMDTILTGDARWIRDHILAALFVSTAWTYEDEAHGSLTVKGPANGDSDIYMIQQGADEATTDNHFNAQANAIDNSNDPFPTIHQELTEHPENGGAVLALVPTNLKQSTEGLSGFYPQGDPNIRMGANQSELIGSLSVAVPGEIYGYHDSGVWLAEWKGIPSDYIVAVTTDGDRVLAMREEPEDELRGFTRVAERNDYPFFESQYRREAGFGAQNRVGAYVMRIGNASYAVPTGYESPMP